MENKKLILTLTLIVIIIATLSAFTVFFVREMNKKNVSIQKASPVEIKKDDTQTKKNEAPSPVLSPDSLGPVASSGQVLSVADDAVKIKDSTGELELKLVSATKIYVIEVPNPPALKDKSILKEGASVLFEYDKGTFILNSILVQ